jgi:nucleoside-diphosphate-sugar epimerase
MSNMSYSPYGVTKALGEYYAKNLNGRIVKFWNVYGIENDMAKAHVITDFILKAKHNNIIDMMTDGQEERQLLYSEDCCKCLEIVANNFDKISKDKELHITNFEWFKIIDVAYKIANLFPGTTVIPSTNKDTVQLNKKNEPDPYILNFWKPEVTINEGLAKISSFYKNSNF